MLISFGLKHSIRINEIIASPFAYANETKYMSNNTYANDYDNKLSSELMTG